MKQEKFDIQVNQILDTMENWCNKQKIEVHRTGPYSVYIDGNQISKSNLQEQLNDYLISTLNITLKKLQKIVCFILTGGRMYVLFKNKVEMQ